MDDSRGLRPGHLVALAGAALALLSLWAPWYRVDLDALRQALQQQPGFSGTSLGGFVQSIAALLPHSISGDAWQTLHRLDVLVAFASGAAIVALLAAAGSFGPGIRVAHDAAARVAVAAGAVCALFVAGRLMNPPGPNAIVDVRWGAWACLLGCGLMVAGGIAAAGRAAAAGGAAAAGKGLGEGQCASTAPPSATPPGASPRLG
jgi:hypothetical protein